MIKILINQDPDACIYCNSHEIRASTLTNDGSEVYRDVECLECNRDWTERFELTSISITDYEFGLVSYEASLRFGMQMPRDYKPKPRYSLEEITDEK